MKPQHVIYLTGSTAVHYTREKSRYVAVSGYDLATDDLATLVGVLADGPARTVAIIADVLEEEHTRDTIPRLGKRDQQAMLARKLVRLFPRTSYRTATVQGRLPADPDTQRVILSGLSKADQLRSLQGMLAAARVPVSVVCSPALLSSPILDKLRPAKAGESVLVVTRQREGGLRLSFFRDRDLLGSRLLRQSLAAPPGDFGRLVRQLEESIRYFDPAFAPSATSPVHVVLLCEPGVDAARAEAEGSGHEGFRLHVPDPAVAARQLGLASPLEAGNGDLLFVELLRRHGSRGNFAPPEERRYFQLHQARVFGRAACLAIGAAALTGAALETVSLLDMAKETAAVRDSAADISRQLETRLTVDRTAGADPLEMQRIGTAWQLLKQHAVEPDEIFGLVSKALADNPQVQIEAIEWTLIQPVSATAEAVPAPSADADDGGEDGVTAENPGEAQPELAGETARAAGEQRVRLTIKGRIEPFDGNFPQAFLGMRTFMTDLKSDPRVVSIKARKEPLDVSPRSSVSGEMTPNTRTGDAGFTLNVLMAVNHGAA
ncbi:MAG: hypothetical protein J0M16_06495 [Gammaproteobacteria bacterium]|nr:hypothetical protein [Gammaproteobacteria bacterium]